jgi:predicted transglutaminase-like cysteine proteinase
MKSVSFAVAMLLSTQLFGVVEAASPAKPADFAKEFSQSLPPVGFVKFCAANPSECKSVGRRADRLVMQAKQWETILQVNTQVNTIIAPISDQELYGEMERWAYPTDAGDCEDYLLLKKRELERLGFDSGALLITVVLDERHEGHAVLTVATTAGDFILDNRRNDVLLWNETGYNFLKRQSQKDPRRWMALTETKNSGAITASGN